MFEFLDVFGEVLFFPVNPAGLDLAENPLILSCLAVLIGLAVLRTVKGVFYGLIR